jgi:hypothetical protein
VEISASGAVCNFCLRDVAFTGAFGLCRKVVLGVRLVVTLLFLNISLLLNEDPLQQAAQLFKPMIKLGLSSAAAC